MLNPIRMTEFGLKHLLRGMWAKKGAIIGWSLPFLLIAGVLGYYKGPCGLSPANTKEAEIQMGNLNQALELYYTRTDPHRYPTNLDLLVHKCIMQEVPKDPWGEPYIYYRDSRTEFTLYSKGPDKMIGTPDDVHPGM